MTIVTMIGNSVGQLFPTGLLEISVGSVIYRGRLPLGSRRARAYMQPTANGVFRACERNASPWAIYYRLGLPQKPRA